MTTDVMQNKLDQIIKNTYYRMQQHRTKKQKREMKKVISEKGRCKLCQKQFKKSELIMPEWYTVTNAGRYCKDCYIIILQKHNDKDLLDCPICGKYFRYTELKEIEWKPGHRRVCSTCYNVLFKLKEES